MQIKSNLWGKNPNINKILSSHILKNKLLIFKFFHTKIKCFFNKLLSLSEAKIIYNKIKNLKNL